MVPTAALAPVRKHFAKTIDRLALPCAHLVRMNLVLRGDLLKRPVATKRLKRDLRLQPPRKTCVSCSSRIPPQSGEYTLNACPIFRGHLNTLWIPIYIIPGGSATSRVDYRIPKIPGGGEEGGFATGTNYNPVAGFEHGQRGSNIPSVYITAVRLTERCWL